MVDGTSITESFLRTLGIEAVGNDLNMSDLALAQRHGLGRSLFSETPSADSRFV